MSVSIFVSARDEAFASNEPRLVQEKQNPLPERDYETVVSHAGFPLSVTPFIAIPQRTASTVPDCSNAEAVSMVSDAWSFERMMDRLDSKIDQWKGILKWEGDVHQNKDADVLTSTAPLPESSAAHGPSPLNEVEVLRQQLTSSAQACQLAQQRAEWAEGLILQMKASDNLSKTISTRATSSVGRTEKSPSPNVMGADIGTSPWLKSVETDSEASSSTLKHSIVVVRKKAPAGVE